MFRRRGAVPVALTALMTVALVVTGVLAYHAHDAARSHRALAHRTVSDLASAAGWQLSERAQLRYFDLLQESLAQPVFRSWAASGTHLPLSEMPELMEGWTPCRCLHLDTPETFFRLPIPRDGPTPGAADLETLGEPVDEPAAVWLAARLAEEAVRSRESPGSLQNPGAGVLIRPEGGRNRAFVYYLEGMEAAYGYEVGAEALVEALLDPLVEAPLLPESVTRGLPSDSLFRIEVGVPDGPTLFVLEGPEDRGANIWGGVGFPAWFGGMEVRVAVPESRASALVIGGLPASRLPLILLLLALTGGILLVALLLLRQQARLTRMRTDFVAGVTHELRTPLAQIRMFAELLSLGKLSSSEERERALHVIDEESRRLDHLIDNVLGFARMGSATRPSALRPLALDELLPEVVERFRPLARERRATITLDVEPGLRAHADGDAVHRIVLNLLDNAVKYGPRGQRVEIAAHRHGRWARIVVDDQGPGIPDRDRRRIWEAYERLEVGIDRGVAGSGIGLAVVRSIVEGHGGRAFVEDAPGGGARFVVLLPIAAAPAPEESTSTWGATSLRETAQFGGMSAEGGQASDDAAVVTAPAPER